VKPQLQLVAENIDTGERFLAMLDDACTMLDTLGQLQALAGTAMMQHRAHNTDEVCASLKNDARMLRYAKVARAA
jgi:hypothetical protein